MNKKLESYTAKGAMQGVTSKKLDEEIQLKIQLEKERNQLQFDIEELKKKHEQDNAEKEESNKAKEKEIKLQNDLQEMSDKFKQTKKASYKN